MPSTKKLVSENLALVLLDISLTSQYTGAWNHVNTLAALQALSLMLFTKVLNWSVVEVEALLAGVRKDLKDKGIHGYWPV
jgi:hypothetical protein